MTGALDNLTLALGSRLGPTVPAAAISYDSASVAAFAAMSVQPNAMRKYLLDQVIVGGKASGWFQELDWLVIHAAHDEQAGRVNLRAPSKVATSAGTVGFVANQGHAGNAVDGYLDFGEALGAGGKFTLTNAAMGMWVLSGTTLFGTSSTTLRSYMAINTGRMNDANSLSYTGALGHRTLLRRASDTGKRAYLNGVETNADTSASSAIQTGNITLGRAGSSYGNGRVAISYVGGALTAAHMTDMQTRFATYLSGIGTI